MTSQTGSKNILVLKVADLDDVASDFCMAWTSGKPAGPVIAFASQQLMQDTLPPRKLAVIKTMCGVGPIGIRELARRLDRDVDTVQLDVVKLVNKGIVRRDGNRFIFPHDGIRMEPEVVLPRSYLL